MISPLPQLAQYRSLACACSLDSTPGIFPSSQSRAQARIEAWPTLRRRSRGADRETVRCRRSSPGWWWACEAGFVGPARSGDRSPRRYRQGARSPLPALGSDGAAGHGCDPRLNSGCPDGRSPAHPRWDARPATPAPSRQTTRGTHRSYCGVCAPTALRIDRQLDDAAPAKTSFNDLP